MLYHSASKQRTGAEALTGAAGSLEELGRSRSCTRPLAPSDSRPRVPAETHLSDSQVPGGCSRVILMLGTKGSQFVLVLEALQPG